MSETPPPPPTVREWILADQNKVTRKETKSGFTLYSWYNGLIYYRKVKGRNYYSSQGRRIPDADCLEREGKEWSEIDWELTRGRIAFSIFHGVVYYKLLRKYKKKKKGSSPQIPSPSRNDNLENENVNTNPSVTTPPHYNHPHPNMTFQPSMNNNMIQPSRNPVHSYEPPPMINNQSVEPVRSKKRKFSELDEMTNMTYPQNSVLVLIHPDQGDCAGNDYVDVHLDLSLVILQDRFKAGFIRNFLVHFGNKMCTIEGELNDESREKRLNFIRVRFPDDLEIGRLEENSNVTIRVFSPPSDVVGSVQVYVRYNNSVLGYIDEERPTQFTYFDASGKTKSSSSGVETNQKNSEDFLNDDEDGLIANMTMFGDPFDGNLASVEDDFIYCDDQSLFYTVGKGDLEGVKKLVEEENFDVCYEDYIGYRASFYANHYGFNEIYRYLITKEQEQQVEEQKQEQPEEQEQKQKQPEEQQQKQKEEVPVVEKENNNNKNMFSFKYKCSSNCGNEMKYEVDENGIGCFSHVCKARSRKCNLNKKRMDQFQSIEHKVTGSGAFKKMATKRGHKCTIDILTRGACSCEDCPMRNLSGGNRVKVGERKIVVISKI